STPACFRSPRSEPTTTRARPRPWLRLVADRRPFMREPAPPMACAGSFVRGPRRSAQREAHAGRVGRRDDAVGGPVGLALEIHPRLGGPRAHVVVDAAVVERLAGAVAIAGQVGLQLADLAADRALPQ